VVSDRTAAAKIGTLACPLAFLLVFSNLPAFRILLNQPLLSSTHDPISQPAAPIFHTRSHLQPAAPIYHTRSYLPTSRSHLLHTIPRCIKGNCCVLTPICTTLSSFRPPVTKLLPCVVWIWLGMIQVGFGRIGVEGTGAPYFGLRSVETVGEGWASVVRWRLDGGGHSLSDSTRTMVSGVLRWFCCCHHYHVFLYAACCCRLPLASHRAYQWLPRRLVLLDCCHCRHSYATAATLVRVPLLRHSCVTAATLVNDGHCFITTLRMLVCQRPFPRLLVGGCGTVARKSILQIQQLLHVVNAPHWSSAPGSLAWIIGRQLPHLASAHLVERIRFTRVDHWCTPSILPMFLSPPALSGALALLVVAVCLQVASCVEWITGSASSTQNR
jgi:hypothetical protein